MVSTCAGTVFPCAAIDFPCAGIVSPRAAIDFPCAGVVSPRAAIDLPCAASVTSRAASVSPHAAIDSPRAGSDLPLAATLSPRAGTRLPLREAGSGLSNATSPRQLAEGQRLPGSYRGKGEWNQVVSRGLPPTVSTDPRSPAPFVTRHGRIALRAWDSEKELSAILLALLFGLANSESSSLLRGSINFSSECLH